MAKRARVAQCTHIDMDRISARDSPCHVCGKVPSVGFLYECREDPDYGPLRAFTFLDQQPPKSDLRLQLEHVGLSDSIITTAEQGDYTDAQLELLKEQKKHLREAIEDAAQREGRNGALSRRVAMKQEPSNHDGAAASKIPQTLEPSTCILRACHPCRPYFRERVPISFQAVLVGDFPAVTVEELDSLPVKSVDIMRTIGLGLTNTASSVAAPKAVSSTREASGSPATRSIPCSNPSNLLSNFKPKTTQNDHGVTSPERSPRQGLFASSRRSRPGFLRNADGQRTFTFTTHQGPRTIAIGNPHSHCNTRLDGSNDMFRAGLLGAGMKRDCPDTEDEPDAQVTPRKAPRGIGLENTETGDKEAVDGLLGFANASLRLDRVVSSSATDSENALDSSYSSDDFSLDSFLSDEDDEDDENEDEKDAHDEVEGGVALTQSTLPIRLRHEVPQRVPEHTDDDGDGEQHGCNDQPVEDSIGRIMAQV